MLPLNSICWKHRINPRCNRLSWKPPRNPHPLFRFRHTPCRVREYITSQFIISEAWPI